MGFDDIVDQNKKRTLDVVGQRFWIIAMKALVRSSIAMADDEAIRPLRASKVFVGY